MKTTPKLIIIIMLLFSAALIFNSCGKASESGFTSVLERNPYNSEYDASSGLTPDRASTSAWKPYKTVSNSTVVNDGALVINSGDDPVGLSGYFTQGDVELAAPTPGNPWVINVSLKQGPGTGIGNSSHSQITFNPMAGQSGALEIGQDEIFIRGSDNSKGASAKRDTEGGFHDYTIVVYYDGLVEVYYEDESEPVLTGSLVYQPGVPVRIAFGDIATDASGTSYWKHVKHNAGKETSPEGKDEEFNHYYDASFGYLPTATCWDMINTLHTNPAIINGVLAIDSGTNPLDFQAFSQASLISPTEGKPWVIEVNARYGTGTSSHTSRAPMQVQFTPFADQINALQIGKDEFFLLGGQQARGETASRDTDDDFHTYTIKAYADGTIEVYYDDEQTPAITGSLVYWQGTTVRIYFGDWTTAAYGTSYWRDIKHNALKNCDCQASII